MEAISIGVPYELFWHLNPKKLKQMNQCREKEKDAQMWYMGQYVKCALDATVMNVFRGKGKENIQYPQKPFFENVENEKKSQQISEEEIIRQTQAIFAQLETKSNNEKRQKRFMEKKGEVE